MKRDLKIFLSELGAAVIFTTAYLVLVGRLVSESYSINFLQAAMGVALIYFSAVFISSYKFAADIFIFYSLFRCITEKSIHPLIINIPAQIIGTLFGFLFYVFLYNNFFFASPIINLESITTFHFEKNYLKYFLFGSFIFILNYFIFLIRVSFELNRMMGAIIIALIVYMLTALSFPMYGISVTTFLPDLFLYFYHQGFNFLEDITGILPALSALFFIAGGILMAYFKIPRTESKHFLADESFSTDYDI